ncbi:aminopeptidase N [Nocardioides sp. Root1257]|uniref:aminopeptidase N n=1 Tax=unclassified Nocardioides TaxID=2615069 RepID=UPI00070049F9|nr:MULTISPECIES: aminopeptidase N [unclassified Nocardioides]KQW52968.1 aminopeptidase N [Nocardioides sp. Root1257]KRC55656.1 aminopeptidase N [Nocardioides sp. Root224]
MTSPYQSLQRTEALARRQLLDIQDYELRLDLASDEKTFGSVTTIRFTSQGGPTFLDLKPVRVNEIRLNGATVDPDLLVRGRLPIETVTGDNELVVDAVMPFRNDGEGLHRSTDPADGRTYVYGMMFMDAAPTVFACFDQPDLKAPYTLHVRAPEDWTVVANAPGSNPEAGTWEFERSQPLSTYFVTLVAGPYFRLTDEHDGIPLGLGVRRSMASALEADADELFTMTKQCFDEFHRLFGIRYPFGKYDQMFVPEFNAGAMENPGCVTFRDPLVFTSRVTRGMRIQRATTVAHEMAHQWFGNIVTPQWWDDLWLNESFAEYMGNRVTADVTEYADAWVDNAYARRQWGLSADQRPSTHPVAGNGAKDASAALQDFDGISYAKGSSILKQLNATMGDEVFFAGVIDHFTRHRFGNATMHDLFESWERAGAGDLSAFTTNWLRTAGPDRIVLDRSAGVIRRTPPADHPADRSHTFRVAVATDGEWSTESVTLGDPETSYDLKGEALVLDPFEDTWAVVEVDTESADALADLLPSVDDPGLRAGIWNNVRSAFHNGALSPAAVVDLVVASAPVESTEDSKRRLAPWLYGDVLPLAPAGSLERVHAAALGKLGSTEVGSEFQLSAFRMAVSTASDPAELRGWLAATPTGIDLDLDLRWRVLGRLAALGATDADELRAALDAEPTGESRVAHMRAAVSLPTAEAKALAWDVFTGRLDVPNYELEAAGLGMWRGGQEELTAAYVDRYFDELPATVAVRSGWVLADATEFFFPVTSLTGSTLERALAMAADDSLDLSVRRRLSDCADDLARKLAIRTAFDAS